MASIRNKEIVEKRKNGRTYRSLAEEYNLTPERIRQIYFRTEREERLSKSGNELYKLPRITANALIRAGIHTKDELVEYCKIYSRKEVKRIYCIGEKGIYEIENLIGFRLKEEKRASK